MGTREEKMVQLGHTYINDTPAPASLAWMDKVAIVGDMAYVSGHTAGEGKVPTDCSADAAKTAAENAAGQALLSLKAALGSLDRVQRIVRITGYVNTQPDFHGVVGVVNGASEFLHAVLGDAGKHARAALGQAQLPANRAVEIDMIVQIKA